METFEQTFGAKAQRKRPKVPAVDMEVTVVLFLTEDYILSHGTNLHSVFAHVALDICQLVVIFGKQIEICNNRVHNYTTLHGLRNCTVMLSLAHN